MRGIGTASGGWPSVSYIVDGVPQTSTDSIQRVTLEDIERIEILRGPQSAMYGFNAIAGAINVITSRRPMTGAFATDLIYGNGPDRQVGGTMSGAIVPDMLLLRLSADYRDDNGLLRSASNGVNLDFRDWKQVQGKLLFIPLENLTVTLSGNWDKEHDGATYEDKVPARNSPTTSAMRSTRGERTRARRIGPCTPPPLMCSGILNRFSVIATLD